MKAALFVGSWEAHTPPDFGDWCEALLKQQGFEVVSHNTLAPLADPAAMADVDLIVPMVKRTVFASG